MIHNFQAIVNLVKGIDSKIGAFDLVHSDKIVLHFR